jgi:hypothetical protein
VKLSDDINLKLEDCAIAVFKKPDEMTGAIDELEKRGFEYYVLEGESGQESLQPKQEGVAATLQKLAAAFGDELRVIDRLDKSLSEGDLVLIVKAEDRQPEVVEMLTEEGGKFLWQFRGWTFNSAGSAGEGKPPVAEEDGS